MTDPIVTITVFAAFLLLFCLLAAAAEKLVELRERRLRRRAQLRRISFYRASGGANR